MDVNVSFEERRDQLREELRQARDEEEMQRLEHELETLHEESRKGWGEPTPLPELPPVPPWDEELLPEPLRQPVMNIAHRAQCPPDFPATALVVGLGSVIGRGCMIRPKQLDDWTVCPNLWGMCVGRPSAMKSPPVREVLRPMVAMERAEHDDWRARDFERTSAEAKLKRIQRKMSTPGRSDIPGNVVCLDEYREDFEAAQGELRDANRLRRFVLQDATVEKVGELLNENPRGLLLLRDELMGWLRSLDRQGHESDRAFYLEAWDGTGSFTYDRIKRGTVAIDAATVSIIGTIQPGPLRAYLRAAVRGTGGDDGLMQRFQLAVYPDVAPGWTLVDETPQGTGEVSRLFDQLAYALPERDPLRFDDMAQSEFNRWWTAHENRLRGDDLHPAIESHLVKYRSLVPSLALVFHLADQGQGRVGLDAIRRAIRWMPYLEGHAHRIYASVAMADTDAARLLLRKIRHGKLGDRFSARDVQRHGWTGLSDAESVHGAIDVLEDHGFVRTHEKRGDIGRPKKVVEVHPDWRRHA